MQIKPKPYAEYHKLLFQDRGNSLWMLSFIIAALFFSACDASNLGDEQEVVTSLSSIELIESMVMTPIPKADEEAEQEYLLKVTMKPRDDIQYPDVINLLGMSENMPASLIYDDGSGYDQAPNDLVFTGVVLEACSPYKIPEGVAGKDIFSISISCEGDFLLPGQECEGHGICPEEVSRSLLWGLIEYDTSVAVCWCGFQCSFEVEFKIGK